MKKNNKTKDSSWNEKWFRFELIPKKDVIETVKKQVTFRTVKGEKRVVSFTAFDFRQSKKKEALKLYHPAKLISLVRSIPNIKPAPEYMAFPDKDDKECYYKIDLPNDKIRFQVNMGSKKLEEYGCPEISIDTLNRFPDDKTLERVKGILRFVSSRSEMEVQCYNTVFSVSTFIKLIDEWKKR